MNTKISMQTGFSIASDLMTSLELAKTADERERICGQIKCIMSVVEAPPDKPDPPVATDLKQRLECGSFIIVSDLMKSLANATDADAKIISDKVKQLIAIMEVPFILYNHVGCPLGHKDDILLNLLDDLYPTDRRYFDLAKFMTAFMANQNFYWYESWKPRNHIVIHLTRDGADDQAKIWLLHQYMSVYKHAVISDFFSMLPDSLREDTPAAEAKRIELATFLQQHMSPFFPKSLESFDWWYNNACKGRRWMYGVTRLLYPNEDLSNLN